MAWRGVVVRRGADCGRNQVELSENQDKFWRLLVFPVVALLQRGAGLFAGEPLFTVFLQQGIESGTG